MRLLSMTCPTEVVASSSGVSAVTVMASETSPGVRVISTSSASSTRNSRPPRVYFLNPANSAEMLYVPGGRYGIS